MRFWRGGFRSRAGHRVALRAKLWAGRFWVLALVSCWIFITLTPVLAVPSPLFPRPRQQAQAQPALATANQPSLAQSAEDSLTLGKQRYDAGLLSEAIEAWSQAATQFARQHQPLAQAAALRYLAIAHQDLGDLSAAEILSNQAWAIVQSQPRTLLFAQILNTQGTIQLSQGKARNAHATFRQAEVSYQALGDRSGMTLSQLNQIQALQSLGFYRRAEAKLLNLRQSLGLYPEGKRSLVAGEMYRIPSQKTELPTEVQLKEQVEIIQKINLESVIRTAPKVITDTFTTQKYILAQTKNNLLHCLSTTGEKLWSIALRKPILSDIIALKNTQKGQTELLFNTEKAIYLYNLQGEEVQPPLEVKSKMTNGVTAIDFDNDENYQLFVASKNKNIYGFTLAGEPLPNWSPLRKKGKFITPLQHFNTADKDFIFGINDKGVLEVFQRDGSDRFPHPVKIRDGYVTPPAYDLHPDMTRIIALDENGRLTVVNAEGESFSLNVRIGENQRPQLLFKDVVGDSRKDYVVLSKTHLAAWTYVGKEFKMQYKVIFDQDTPRELFAVENGIGIVSKKTAEIDYFLNSGEQHPDFPLGGTTAFTVTDLFEDNRACVIVGNGKEIYIYEIVEEE